MWDVHQIAHFFITHLDAIEYVFIFNSVFIISFWDVNTRFMYVGCYHQSQGA